MAQDTSRLDAWRRITLDPCNRSVERRNTAAIRDGFEQIINYITNINNSTVVGDGTLVFFKVTATSLGTQTTTAKELTTPSFLLDGRDFTIYDYTPDKRFAQNYVDGYYGCGRLSEDIAPNAVVVIELEGKARFIDGTLAENLQDAGVEDYKHAQVNVDHYWGAFPNIHDPGTSFDVFDRDNLLPNAKGGERFIAVWDEQDQIYVFLNHNNPEVIFFEISGTTNLGAASIEVKELNLYTLAYTGRTMTAYDVTPDRRYAQNFVTTYRGCGRHAPEIADDAIAIFELEGKARYIDGELTSTVASGSATATVENYWGAYPDIHDPGSPVTVYDREGYADGALSGSRYLAVWDEQEQKYILILPVVCDCVGGDMEFLEFCGDGDTLANSCCLYSGQIYRIDPETPGFCLPDFCIVPVWMYCVNTQAGDPWPNGASWCDFGKRVKQNFDCLGDTRDVYLIDCGNCDPCHCPGTHMQATIQPFDCQSAVTLTLTAVTQDPIEEDGFQGWWGEWTYTGFYPIVAVMMPVTPFSFNGEMHQEVYITIGCNATSYATVEDFCTAGAVYVQMASGAFVAYTGAYTVTGGSIAEVSIVDGDECQLFCSRTFKYGMFVRCSNGNLFGGKIYHLYPENSLARHTDSLAGLSVPSADRIFGADNIAHTAPSDCCEYIESGKIDLNTGRTYICDVDMPNESGGGVLTAINVIAYHVIGACKDTIAQRYGLLPICGDTAGSDEATIIFDWSGTNACKGA